jgi:hypothetical protein
LVWYSGSIESYEVDVESQAREAEIRIAGFIAKHNLTFNLSHLINSVCSDSAIAKKIKCGRSKMTSIIKKRDWRN